jgi:hypothetical protein
VQCLESAQAPVDIRYTRPRLSVSHNLNAAQHSNIETAPRSRNAQLRHGAIRSWQSPGPRSRLSVHEHMANAFSVPLTILPGCRLDPPATSQATCTLYTHCKSPAPCWSGNIWCLGVKYRGFRIKPGCRDGACACIIDVWCAEWSTSAAAEQMRSGN